MTDRSKTRIFKLIELDLIKDLKTGLTIKADRLIEKFVRCVVSSGQVLNTTPSTINLGTPLESKGIDVLPDNSVVVKYEDFYDFNCIITANSSNQNAMEIWVESTDDDGVTWVPFPLSGRRQSFSNNNEGDIEFNTRLTLTAGTRFRFRGKSDSSTLTLGGASLINTGNGDVEIPAVVFTMSRI